MYSEDIFCLSFGAGLLGAAATIMMGGSLEASCAALILGPFIAGALLSTICDLLGWHQGSFTINNLFGTAVTLPLKTFGYVGNIGFNIDPIGNGKGFDCKEEASIQR